jgi:hypothetical protein
MELSAALQLTALRSGGWPSALAIGMGLRLIAAIFGASTSQW